MATTRPINLQDLQRELDAFKGRFENWSHGAVASTEARKEEHLKRIRGFSTAIRDLNQHRVELERRAEEVKQRLESEHAQTEQLRLELEKVQADQAALPALVTAVREALQAESAVVDQHAAELADQEKARQRKLEALRESLQMYQDRLGLSFEQREGEQLCVVLTHIDPRRLSRQFKFAVKVLAGDVYEVTNCEPDVAALPALVDGLNASNDFGDFVRAMRREFKALVAGEAPQHGQLP